jgi:hypothetical protein
MRQDLFFDFRFMIFDLLCASNRKSAIENRKFFGGHEAETPKFNADSLRQSLHRDARLWDRRADSAVLRNVLWRERSRTRVDDGDLFADAIRLRADLGSLVGSCRTQADFVDRVGGLCPFVWLDGVGAKRVAVDRRALAGILSSATLPATFAYIGDSTSGENRSGGMGILGAAMGLGMIFGPLLGGPLGKIALPLPFFAAAGFAIIAAFFAFIMLPESLTADKRVAPHGASQSRARELIGALRGPMAFLFVTAFLLAFALANFEAVLGLFALDRFGLGPDQVGYLMGAFGFLGAIQQGVIIGPLTREMGEVRVLQSGLILSVIGFVGEFVCESWSRDGTVMGGLFVRHSSGVSVL